MGKEQLVMSRVQSSKETKRPEPLQAQSWWVFIQLDGKMVGGVSGWWILECGDLAIKWNIHGQDFTSKNTKWQDLLCDETRVPGRFDCDGCVLIVGAVVLEIARKLEIIESPALAWSQKYRWSRKYHQSQEETSKCRCFSRGCPAATSIWVKMVADTASWAKDRRVFVSGQVQSHFCRDSTWTTGNHESTSRILSTAFRLVSASM